jgi:hypothetical protein
VFVDAVFPDQAEFPDMNKPLKLPEEVAEQSAP